MSTKRALHFVFKVGDRTQTTKFYRQVLGMKFLRHEEFEEGCKASCNGPYDGKWSKSMVGFGAEDNHFVVELTYNYGIGSYKLGDDFRGITIHSKQAVENVKNTSWPSETHDGTTTVEAPGGYKFHLVAEDVPNDFWEGKCGMKVLSKGEKSAVLGYDSNQCKLELLDIGKEVDHATAFGRIAFSCPKDELPGIESTMKNSGQKILTPLVSLDTPGKATVQVVIVADPDGHEICFVGDEAFRELSQTDPNADKLLDEGLAADKSDEWFAKKGKSKEAK